LTSTSFNTTLFLVPPLAGLVVARLGSAPAFAFNALSFGVAALCLLFVRGGAPRIGARKESPLRQLREGFTFVWRSPFYRIQLVIAIIYSLGYQGANLVGVPTLAKLTFEAGDAGVGLLYGAGGAGALLGALGVGMVARMARPGLVAGLTLLGAGLGVALVATTATVSGAAIVLFAAVGFHTISAILGISLAQTQAPAEVRGRVMALIMFGAVGLEPLSLSAGGLLGASIGGRGVFLACGIAIALAGALATSSRAWRNAT